MTTANVQKWILALQWVQKARRDIRKQWEEFFRFVMDDLDSEVEYQYEVKDAEGKVTRKGQPSVLWV